MKKQVILTILALSLLIVMSNLASSEIYLWNNVIKDNTTSVVKYHAFYWFDDTSAKGIGKQKDVPITLLYVIEPLPLTLDSGNQIDWCNLSTSHYHNIYSPTFLIGGGGELLNTTIQTQSLFFQNSGLNSSRIIINMRDRDTFTATITCHYANNTNLYEDNILAGRITTFLPSFECEGCNKYSFEELSHQAETSDEITANELIIYNKIQTAVDWNFTIWLVLSWISKIAFLLIAVGLIFAGIYYFYIFIKNLGNNA